MTTKRYLSCAETAKLLRQALKREFPGHRFSVRSHAYAGGASIDVSWTDGPTEAEVNAIAQNFAGGGFDGSIDLAYHVTTWLTEDGQARVAYSPGTEGSRGGIPAYADEPPYAKAELVHMDADYVFCQRDLSP